MKIMEVTVHLDRWPAGAPNAGRLRARVVEFDPHGDVKTYGRDLLSRVAVVRVDTARTLIERMFDRTKFNVHVLVDPAAQPRLEDKPVATPRDRQGWRSSGR